MNYSIDADTDIPCEQRQRRLHRESQHLPALLVAHCATQNSVEDRFCLTQRIEIGRNGERSDLNFADPLLSKRHFCILPQQDGWYLSDLKSSNGTFVNGIRVREDVLLPKNAVIAAGQCLFVFHQHARNVFNPPPNQYGIVGSFHVSSIIEDLTKKDAYQPHFLITGPSGSGKELAASALSHILGSSGSPKKVVCCCAAEFSTDEEAITTLLGVEKAVFSGVNPRRGLIHAAKDEILYLDEMHSLSPKVQRSLLRVIETGTFRHVGSETLQKTNTRFVLATNIDDENAGLVHDLYSRLRKVYIAPLSQRLADIPAIFKHILAQTSKYYDLWDTREAMIFKALEREHFEMMCLDAFPKNNVRGIIQLCESIVSQVSKGHDATEIVDACFSERFWDSPVYCRKRKVKSGNNLGQPTSQSAKRPNFPNLDNTKHSSFNSPPLCATLKENGHYEANRKLIISIFENAANRKFVTTTKILMRNYGIQTSRATIEKYLHKWGVTCTNEK